MQNLHGFGLQLLLRLAGGWLLMGMVELRISSILGNAVLSDGQPGYVWGCV
jgi:hypothetical protein